MEVKLDDLTLDEIISLFRAADEFIEFLEVEENAEVEKRNK